MSLMASVTEAYETVEEALGILKLTAFESYGKDKLCRSLNFPGSRFSRSANGEDLKFGCGGRAYGPEIRPALSSSLIFCSTAWGLSRADWAFFEVVADWGPSNSRKAPDLK